MRVIAIALIVVGIVGLILAGVVPLIGLAAIPGSVAAILSGIGFLLISSRCHHVG